MKHFLVFGSHPRLSLAEYHAMRPTLERPILCGTATLIEDPEWDNPVLMNVLGGTVKLGDILLELPQSQCTPEAIADVVASTLDGTSIDFGWSVFGGGKKGHERLSRLAISFKKELKKRGTSSRWVTGEHGAPLSPAAVAKLKLTTKGLDVCLLVHGETVSIGLTREVQDADAWSARDYGRPARDEKNGMLPPKLARMLVNLANVPTKGTILDPFCGGGTVLMEAALATRAASLIGSDIEAKQIKDTEQNNAWLVEQHILRPDDVERFSVFISDVRKLETRIQPNTVDRVVTEGYLGPPLRGHELQQALTRTAEQITTLWKESLRALRPLLKADGRIVGIWPGFKTEHGTARVDLTNDLTELGYELVDPLGEWESSEGPLIYQRPEQKVARRIVVLKKLNQNI